MLHFSVLISLAVQVSLYLQHIAVLSSMTALHLTYISLLPKNMPKNTNCL